MFFICICCVVAETESLLENDLSSVNLSLYQPFLSEDKRLEILKNINIQLNDLKMKSINGSGGGSIRYVNPQVILDVNNLSIENGFSTGSGGAFLFESSYALQIDNCSFLNVSASSNGGSVYAHTLNSVFITGSLFNITKGNNGGSAYIKTCKVNLTKSWFEKSEALQYGGAILIEGLSSELVYQVYDCYFGQCKSNSNG